MSSFCEGKVAVVTGAAGTLCSVITSDLAKKGAKVALLDRNAERIEALAAGLEKDGCTCACYTGDVTDEASMQAIADKVATDFGPAAYLVNGAGGNQPAALTTRLRFDPAELTGPMAEGEKGFWDVDMAVFESVLKINTMGTVIPSRVFAKQMAQNGGGAILNFCSMNTYRPLTRVAAYAMSKAAIANWTMFFAQYMAPAKVRVNAVAPGFFVNERSKQYLMTPDGGLSARGEQVMAHSCIKRFGEAPELLGCVNWLLDDEKAGFVTGITVPVDGGFLASAGV